MKKETHTPRKLWKIVMSDTLPEWVRKRENLRRGEFVELWVTFS